ncbi:hypothetical protein A0H81_14771 [Grifola frondosa]|uniref:Uncharacterized protein n=1 Tax=Grifola frondosa TaxID=5627 RepID=A0A1C7LL46_GRIFR|nr:hypothetical protein A0H81_14771 [Grifola frondosa]
MAHCSVPLLSELCFRVLLAPPEPTATNTQSAAGQGTQTTILQSLYQCPLEVKAPLVYETLKACVPDAVSKPTEQLSMRKRLRSSSGEKGEALQRVPRMKARENELLLRASGYPAEERWTWEDIIAGVQVGAQGVSGAGVPVLWRGCGRGCLDFLDGEETLPQGDDGPDERMDVDADMGEDEDAVQIVQLGMDGLVDPAEFA